ncbi:exo-alpha-sialidase [Asticcacaulis sp. 201]|uniref:exo-alpha-sialidase n=1 Tax=Asticcacaulis sp. 201 TaxID=3028787 RepID=UPI0029163F05|nr:exo-alpha-sialidase [Asticcacaulis sp. 201]MDV6330978.1 exo-alpha-sialidase [Asticcacaulis sp. 201]
MMKHRGMGAALGAIVAVLMAGEALAQTAPVKSEPYIWATAPMGGGGFVDGFVYHPEKKGLLYARTDVGGAYRWDAAEQLWMPLLDSASSADGLGIFSLAVDPQDANTVYVAAGLYTSQWGGNGAVLRSDDQGQTWRKTDLPVKLGGNEDGRNTGERLQVDPNARDILFLGTTTGGLLKSADGGKTWSAVSSFPEAYVTFVLFDRDSGQRGAPTPTLYAGVKAKNAGLYVSHDGGVSWQVVKGAPKGFMAHHGVFDGDSRRLYVTFSDTPGPNDCKDGAVYRYDTVAGSWTDITPQKPGHGGPSFCYAGASAAASVPGTLVVTTLDRWWGGDTAYRSTDGGAHWIDIGATSKHDANGYPWMSLSRNGHEAMGHWMSDIEINPFDPNEAIYGTGDGLWMTQNLADADSAKPVTWTFEVGNFEETAPLDLISPPAGAHLMAAVGDVGGFRYLNFEASPPAEGGYFQPAAGSNRSIDFAELNPGFVVRVADGDAATRHALYSLDNGKTWADMPSAPPIVTHDADGWYAPGRIAVSARGAAMVWVTGKGDAYSSLDRGKSWLPSQGFPQMKGRAFPVFSDRSTEGVFYAYDASAGNLSVSTDGGLSFKVFVRGLPVIESWRSLGQPRAVPGRLRDIWVPTPQGLFHSPDPDSPFKQVRDISEAAAIGFGKSTTGQDYPAVYMWGRYKGVWGIFRSDDAGGSWVRINDDAHQYGGGLGGQVIGDPRQYGLVYITTSGRGVALGQPAVALGDASSTQK